MDRREYLDGMADGGFLEGDMLFAGGFDEALIGYAGRLSCEGFKHVACYDYETCVSLLMNRDGMDEDEAIEFFEFNVVGAYVGESGPMFIHVISESDLDDASKADGPGVT